MLWNDKSQGQTEWVDLYCYNVHFPLLQTFKLATSKPIQKVYASYDYVQC